MDLPFKRGVIAPFGAISDSWRLIRDQYLLFVGISTVGMLLGGLAPMGILLGPMMCGIYACLGEKLKGRRVGFEGLFTGFKSPLLLQSILAALIMMTAALVILTIFVVIVAIVVVALGIATGLAKQGGSAFALLLAGAFLLWLAVATLAGLPFAFTFPLIVDRQLGAIDAITLSARATLGNLGGVLGLYLLTTAMSLVGVCFCYVGAFLVAPLGVGALMVAYERVFGLSDLQLDVRT